jgi:hypothetical protein
MQCPVCEAENRDDAPECSGCGKMLQAAEEGAPAEAAPIDGLESTRLEQDAEAPLQWTAGALELERTALEADPAAPSSWGGEVEIDRGRDEDGEPRTPAPEETATCPWCGFAALGAVCDNCGRRKARFATPPPAEAPRAQGGGETVSCPSCFARVPKAARCSDCGLPFPVQEL